MCSTVYVHSITLTICFDRMGLLSNYGGMGNVPQPVPPPPPPGVPGLLSLPTQLPLQMQQPLGMPPNVSHSLSGFENSMHSQPLPLLPTRMEPMHQQSHQPSSKSGHAGMHGGRQSGGRSGASGGRGSNRVYAGGGGGPPNKRPRTNASGAGGGGGGGSGGGGGGGGTFANTSSGVISGSTASSSGASLTASIIYGRITYHIFLLCSFLHTHSCISDQFVTCCSAGPVATSSTAWSAS